jgi:Na+-translocating ferredoxin:NAD+ oxidoreductase RnfA subunit
MEKYEQIKESRKRIFINNFIGGIAWALGATIGLALIVTILTLILKNVNVIPVIGNFIGNIIQFIITKNPNLLAR